MSGLTEWPVTAVVVLHCNARDCSERWESEVYDAVEYTGLAAYARLAFDLGWRVFSGARTQHTYCPNHGPSVPMRQAYPAVTP